MSSSTNHFARITGLSLIVLLILAITLCLIIPKGNEVLWVNGNYSAFQDTLFSSITVFGSVSLFALLVVGLAFIRFHYSILFGTVFLINSLIVLIFKRVIFPDMERPLAWIDHSLLHFVEGMEFETMYSFPSGHTATAFAMAITFSLLLKRKRWAILFIALAILIGYSRIYLLQHHLMDVVAGAIIGSASSFITYFMKPARIMKVIYEYLQTLIAADKGKMIQLARTFVMTPKLKRWAERVLSETY